MRAHATESLPHWWGKRWDPLIAVMDLRISNDVCTRVLRREAALSKTAATFQCNPHCSPPSWGSPSPTLAPSNDDRTSIILRGKRSCQSPGICCGRSPTSRQRPQQLRSPTSRQRPQQLDNVTPLALEIFKIFKFFKTKYFFDFFFSSSEFP